MRTLIFALGVFPLWVQICGYFECSYHPTVVTESYSSLTFWVFLLDQWTFVGLPIFLPKPVGLREGEVPGSRDPVLT